MKSGYHHGDLRRTILDAAVEAIGQSGVDGWSMRELARRADVSHAAPAHHFGDRAGLFTALAAEAFELLADELTGGEGDFLETGLGYVAFAVAHPVHFEVMFQRSLYRTDDPEVRAAEQRAAAALESGVDRAAGSDPDRASVALAGWSIAHGFASLWLGGALGFPADADPVASARPVLARLRAE